MTSVTMYTFGPFTIGDVLYALGQEPARYPVPAIVYDYDYFKDNDGVYIALIDVWRNRRVYTYP